MTLVKTDLNGLEFWYREDDRFVGQRIALQKYEEYETKLIQYEILRLAKLTQDTAVAVDVGANIGYYTLLLAQKCKKVYAIEPDKDCFEILKKNVAENKLENVVLINAAAGSKEEKKYLVKDKLNLGNSKIIETRNEKLDDRIEQISCLRLDDILINEHKIDLIKIDVQGWEPQVIKGGEKILKRDKPNLFLEYNGDLEMINFLENIYKNILSIDYWFYVCKKGIWIDKKTGYVDLWITNKNIGIWNRYKDIKIKKLIKKIIGVK